VAAALKQVVGELVELHHRLLDPVALLHQVRGVELPLDPVRPIVEPCGPRELGSHHRRDRQRRVRLAELLDELAAPAVGERAGQLLKEAAHRRAVALDRARREGRVHEVAQTAVIVAVETEDVARDLLEQRTLSDTEDLGHLQPGERDLLTAQEKLDSLPVEHEVAERPLREPARGV
jgi:hypothetical protein